MSEQRPPSPLPGDRSGEAPAFPPPLQRPTPPETPPAARPPPLPPEPPASSVYATPQPAPQPQDVQQAPVQRGTNGFAIASLILGIVWISWIGSILALVFGYIARSQIKRSGGAQGGRGMAIAGIILGWIGIATLILYIIFIVVAVANDPYY